MGPPDAHIIPAYVTHAYNVTHSLVVWAIILVILRLVIRSPGRTLWPFGAWGLHILCDIPTHSTRFFPTPYLWPLHTPFYNGHSWGNKTFMIANYTLITLTYAFLWLTHKISGSFRRKI